MQPPRKPWEGAAYNAHTPMVSNRTGYSGTSPLLHSSSPSGSVQQLAGQFGNVSNSRQHPPPIPRRDRAPANTSQNIGLRQTNVPGYGYNTYSGLSGYGGLSGYSGYGGLSGYGGYNSYGGYGGYNSYSGLGSFGCGGYGGYGFNRFSTPNPNDPESQFIQLAEESSRPAFQSIESLVQAFHSVSMMLDSTFNAVHMSFRAVLGVAENFGRLRRLFAQFFSSVALFRAFIWLYKKVLYLLGLRHVNPGREELWQQAMEATGEELAAATGRPRSSWPILMFMGIVFTGPYLIFKLMSSLSSSSENGPTAPSQFWDPSVESGTPAVAMYDFIARNEDEMSIQAGQRIEIAPFKLQTKDASGDWLYARLSGSSQMGLVPINYIARYKPGNQSAPVASASSSTGIGPNSHTLSRSSNPMSGLSSSLHQTNNPPDEDLLPSNPPAVTEKPQTKEAEKASLEGNCPSSTNTSSSETVDDTKVLPI